MCAVCAVWAVLNLWSVRSVVASCGVLWSELGEYSVGCEESHVVSLER